MSTYSRANRTAQWFGNKYDSARFKPNCGVLHSTETNGWPGYDGGSMGPNYTGFPNFRTKTIDWRAHFEDEESSRALENRPGGVETNRANAIQVELIGTCDAKYRVSRRGWGKAGVNYVYWSDAPEWALNSLADFLADMNRRHGIPLSGPSMWLTYGLDSRAPGRNPASYGKSPARFSFKEWQNFYGWCGHQHVPENDHGDPGSLDASRVFAIARAKVSGVTPKPPTTVPSVQEDDMPFSPEQIENLTGRGVHDQPVGRRMATATLPLTFGIAIDRIYVATMQITAISAALKVLAENQGLEPERIEAIIKEAVAAALADTPPEG